MSSPMSFTISSFTNPNGQRVHQAFCHGMPITRELDEYDRAASAAREAFAAHNGRALLLSWDGDTAQGAEIEAKAA